MTTHGDRSGRTGRAATAAGWLAAVTAAVVAGASAAGLSVPALYTDGAAVTAMFRGYDAVTLAVVAPLLAFTLLPRWRGRPLAQLLRISMLTYCIYNYAYYLFGAQLNAALLAHIAIFTTSLYALVLTLGTLDVDGVAAAFRRRTPVRVIAVIIVLLAVPLAMIQVSGLAGHALSGIVLQEPSKLVVPLEFTRLGAVLDLSLLVPAYLVAAIWLWRRRAWGYVFATAALVAGALHQVSYVAATILQMTSGIPGASFDTVEPIILTLFALASALLLVNIDREAWPAPRSGPGPTLLHTGR
jgi:hypothetical protein